MSEPANTYLAEGDDERERLRIQASLQGDRDLNVIAAATRELPGPLAGIDLGCDDGHLTRLRFASERFECVLGLDRPEPAIAAAAAQTTDPRFHFEVAEFESGDLAQRLEGFAAGQPTAVFASFVAHLLDDPRSVLAALYRGLPSGSRVLLREIDEGLNAMWPDPDGIYARIVELSRRARGEASRMHARRLPVLLKRAGFRDVRFSNNTHASCNFDDAGRRDLARAHFGFRLEPWFGRDPEIRRELAELVPQAIELVSSGQSFLAVSHPLLSARV